jgi:hypothetical protein
MRLITLIFVFILSMQYCAARADSSICPLVGIKSVRLLVDLSELAKVKGVDQEAVRTSVEQSLRNNGLVVYETFSPDEDGLFLVTVTDRKVHGGGYLYDISGKLLEPVHLKRTGAKLVSVETWSESVLGDATDDNASANLNKSITRIMDVFAADYAKDNAEAKHG